MLVENGWGRFRIDLRKTTLQILSVITKDVQNTYVQSLLNLLLEITHRTHGSSIPGFPARPFEIDVQFQRWWFLAAFDSIQACTKVIALLLRIF